ncbi:MAG: thioredoxin-related protein [Sulfurimonas sp.]|uniref:thioredoxin family protein n=1 Tax=Sulfurimonas sp. TaxID=2022749 RepID=UPI0039E3CF80
MKLLLLPFIFLASLHSYELNWIHNYEEAFVLAQKEQKNVYLFIGADNCRFCERFKDLTLSKKEVMKTLKENYIPLYLNRDQHKIPRHFVIQGVPRHYFLTPCGKVIHEDAGSREPAGFYDILDEVELKLDDD